MIFPERDHGNGVARAFRFLMAFFVFAVAGCGSSVPIIRDLSLVPNPNRRVPLAAIFRFATDRPTRALIIVSDADRTGEIGPQTAYFATEHELVVLGLRPNRRHTVRVVVEDGDGNETRSEGIEFTTAPLPRDFPPIDIRISRPGRMEPGVTLIPTVRWPGNGALDRDFGLVLAVDAYGEVVWYYRANPYRSPARAISFFIARDS